MGYMHLALQYYSPWQLPHGLFIWRASLSLQLDQDGQLIMKESIRRQNPGDEFYTAEGCYIIELSNSPDDPEVSIARARLEPGVTTRWHRLDEIVERYVILAGRGRVEIGSLPPTNVSVGDVVLIPQMCRQRISNIGVEDLVFLAICTPRYSDAAYEDINDKTD